jgi:hypothetical protein
MTLVQWWYWRNHRVHRDEVDRLLAFARAEDPHPHQRPALGNNWGHGCFARMRREPR